MSIKISELLEFINNNCSMDGTITFCQDDLETGDCGTVIGQADHLKSDNGNLILSQNMDRDWTTILRRSDYERKQESPNLTLGQLITELEKYPEGMSLKDHYSYYDSYRGYYVDVALCPDGDIRTVGQLLEKTRQEIGETEYGYKGGEYVMDENSIIWIADYGHTGPALVGVRQTVEGTLELLTREVK